MPGLILFLKANIKGYTRADGTVVKPHQDSRPTGDKWFGDDRHVAEVVRHIQASPHRHHGLRITSGHPVTGEADVVGVGDILPNSYRWNDGNPTQRQLKGTSTLRVRTEADVRSAIKLASQYVGRQVALVGSHEKRPGADEQEAVLTAPKVLATWERKERKEKVAKWATWATPGSEYSVWDDHTDKPG